MKVRLQQMRDGRPVELPNTNAEEEAIERLEKLEAEGKVKTIALDDAGEEGGFEMPREFLDEFTEAAFPFEVREVK